MTDDQLKFYVYTYLQDFISNNTELLVHLYQYLQFIFKDLSSIFFQVEMCAKIPCWD